MLKLATDTKKACGVASIMLAISLMLCACGENSTQAAPTATSEAATTVVASTTTVATTTVAVTTTTVATTVVPTTILPTSAPTTAATTSAPTAFTTAAATATTSAPTTTKAAISTTVASKTSDSVPGSISSGDPAKGKVVFLKNCTGCHPNGGTDSGFGPNLSTSPHALDPAYITYNVRNGRNLMPNFTTTQVNDTDLTNIIAYLKSIHK